MTRQVLSVSMSLCIIGMTSSATFAQSSQFQKSNTLRAVEEVTSEALKLKINAHKLQITEDIEIMRRLIDATVKEFYATGYARSALSSSQSGSSTPGGALRGWSFESSFSNNKTSNLVPTWGAPFSRTVNDSWYTSRRPNLPIRESIGTYLNKHGVVYQLELPPLSEPPKPAKTVAKKSLANCPFMSLSKWERTRQHLNGELKKINCSECHAVKNLQSAGNYFKSNFSRRREIKWTHEFVLEEQSASVLTRDELTEQLIDLLAENGHHIRDLAPPDHLTLAVTFREPPPAPQAATGMGSMMRMMSGGAMNTSGMSGGSAGGMSSMGSGGSGIGLAGPPHLPQGTPVSGSSRGSMARNQPRNSKFTQKRNTGGLSPGGGAFGRSGVGGPGPGVARGFGSSVGGYGEEEASGGGDSGYSASLGNEELAGDLHMRQGRLNQAAEEYQKAVDKMKKNTAFSPRLHQKLAAALLRSGAITKAQAVLDKLKAFEKTRKSTRPKEPEKPAVSLPARLVISVTKANLDAMAAGKISREEFRKQVSIDYFDPATVKPKTRSTETKNKKN